eukprot:SM000168S02608  [mRNA]  locus=s168:133636:139322:- [translate_table: standard]
MATPDSPGPGAESGSGAADPAGVVLQKFLLYETRARYYLVGRDKSRRHWRVLKLDRSEPGELVAAVDPAQCQALLHAVADGNRAVGGLQLVTKAYGIVGCIRFLASYYLILVTKRRQIGTICGHDIYSVGETQLVTIPHASVQAEAANSKAELRYKKLLSGMDLTKDFFFSYTYSVMHTLQQNLVLFGSTGAAGGMPFESMFVWNSFLSRGLRSTINSTQWTVALTKLSIFGRVLVLTLISRRSRHFAGTRYLKRGVNDKGRVANDVEVEQIALDDASAQARAPGLMSAAVQNRGSIPLFWSQEASRLSPKPDIVLQRYDPVYEATRLHFEDLSDRYGDPVIILNLIKTVEKRPREMILRREFAAAMAYLNLVLPEEQRPHYIHWDFHKFAKSKSSSVLAVLGSIAGDALDLTGFFYSGKVVTHKNTSRMYGAKLGAAGDLLDLATSSTSQPQPSISVGQTTNTGKWEQQRGGRLQCGVLRSNCIDCLDRTNVAQYAFGLAALGRQLKVMGFVDDDKIDQRSGDAAALMDMYQSMGDVLALQYGGSAAHNMVFPERQGKWRATTQSQEFLKSIHRYYSNAYTDAEKQDAINLFLGNYIPQDGKPSLWELDSDYHLHVASTGSATDSPRSTPTSGLHGLSESRSEFSWTPFITQLSHYGDGELTQAKLVSFEKLTQMTCGPLKRVRLHLEDGDLRAPFGLGGGNASSDTTEVQLKGANWLFGRRAPLKPSSAKIAEPHAEGEHTGSIRESDENLSWIADSSSSPDMEMFQRQALTFGSYVDRPLDELGPWYGTSLLPTLIEDSEAGQFYQQCSQLAELGDGDEQVALGLTSDTAGRLSDSALTDQLEATLQLNMHHASSFRCAT